MDTTPNFNVSYKSMDLDTLIGDMKYFALKYYNGYKSPISDELFDEIEEYIYAQVSHDDKHKLWKELHFPKSVTNWTSGKHKIPMGSLDKISPNSSHTKESFFSRIGNVSCIVQEKLDGISLSLEYEGGKLVSAKMRNDGIEGDDILENAKFFRNVPLTVSYSKPFCVRGEVVITKEDFDEVNIKSGNKYTALRNAASGIAREYKGTYAKHLSFIAYDIADEGVDYKCEKYKLEALESLNFTVVNNYSNINEIADLNALELTYINEKRASLNYLIDGLVIKVNDLTNINHSVGDVDNPKHQIALKFPAEKVVATLNDITWQVGKRRYTPVLELDPIVVGGVTVARATLHNIDAFTKARLSKGDKIIISRSGDVIPFFEGIHEKGEGELFKAPSKCESCGSALTVKGAYLVCPNEDCGDKALGKILNWFEKLDYKGIASATLTKLFEGNYIKTIADVYTLEKADLINCGFGDVQSDNIINIVDSQTAIPFAKILGSLCIQNLGVRNATKLVNELRIDSMEKINVLNGNDVMSIEGFGDTSFQIVNDIKENIDLLNELIDIFSSLIDFNLVQLDSTSLKGKSFCFTGKFFKNRDEMERLVKINGGDVKGVTSKLDYLVNDDGVKKGKYEKALKLNVPIITSDEFFAMMG